MIVVVIVMMMMMMMVVMVMIMMVVVIIFSHDHRLVFRCISDRPLVLGAQKLLGIRNWLQQLGKGVGRLQNVDFVG